MLMADSSSHIAPPACCTHKKRPASLGPGHQTIDFFFCDGNVATLFFFSGAKVEELIKEKYAQRPHSRSCAYEPKLLSEEDRRKKQYIMAWEPISNELYVPCNGGFSAHIPTCPYNPIRAEKTLTYRSDDHLYSASLCNRCFDRHSGLLLGLGYTVQKSNDE